MPIKLFSMEEKRILEISDQIKPEALCAIMGRSLNAVRIKLSRTGKKYNKDAISNSTKNVSVEYDSDRDIYVVSVGKFSGALNIILV